MLTPASKRRTWAPDEQPLRTGKHVHRRRQGIAANFERV